MTRRAAAAAFLIFFGSAATAHADIPSSATFTSAAETQCQVGDDCINNFTMTPDGTFAGTLAIASNRVVGAVVGVDKSRVSVTARFDNTFVVPRRTTQIGYEAIYRFTGTLTASGANASADCKAFWSGQNRLLYRPLFGVDTNPHSLHDKLVVAGPETFGETFTAELTKERFLRRQLPVFIELTCVLEVAPASRAELTLEGGPDSSLPEDTRTGLKHLHLLEQ